MKFAAALGLWLVATSYARPQSPSEKDSSVSLQRSAVGADAFSRTADGSVQSRNIAADVAAQIARFDRRSRLVLGAERPRLPIEIPSTSVSRRLVYARSAPVAHDLLVAAGAFGMGLLLALGALFLKMTEPEPTRYVEAVSPNQFYPTTVDPVVSALARPGARPITAAERPYTPEAFVDTRMPVGTWRAISRREQALIESWDRSRDKALGRASLEQWIDRHAESSADAAALKAKLVRI